MENEENQLSNFLRTAKKYLSNLCDKCIDQICDSTLKTILISKIEPNKRIETYIELIKEKRKKIDREYKDIFEDMDDNSDNFGKNYIRSDSDHSHLSIECNGQCDKSETLEDYSNKNNEINKIEISTKGDNKKNKGNKKKKKKHAV